MKLKVLIRTRCVEAFLSGFADGNSDPVTVLRLVDRVGRSRVVNWDAYTKAIVEIELPIGPITVGPRGTICATEADFPDGQGRTIHVITADNANGTTQSPEANERSQGTAARRTRPARALRCSPPPAGT